MMVLRSPGAAIVVALLTGCYTLQPVRSGTAPHPGTQVALDVNDVGRVALGGAMGPEIAQLEGRLVSNTNGEYVVAVSTVRLLRGGEQIWSGEQVRIRTDYVGSVYERQFSMGRTIALSAVTVGSIAVFVVTRSILGGGTDDLPPDGGKNPEPDTQRIPRR